MGWVPEEEWDVEEIVGEREIGPRQRKREQLLVKWVGYSDPTWEPREAFENVAALDRFEAARGRAEGVREGRRNVTGYAQAE